jgi:signal transduction histidine kinase
MVIAGRRITIALFISLGAGLIFVVGLLYVGWVLLNWRTGILLFLGLLLTAFIIGGVVLNTIFLVREIRLNAQHDAFINAVTHELKTPIASIRLYLETLLTHDVGEAKRKEFYGVMLADSERLIALIDQVLRASRLGISSAALRRTRVDLNPLIGECLERVRALHQVSADGLRFEAVAPVCVLGDPDELRAAVTNLIENAVKYSGRNVKVVVQTSLLEGTHVELRVRDRGPGIEKDDLKRIFKRFYRAQGKLAARVKGSGLGLYIVRSVAKRHGGNVWAESEGPGRGSTFVLRLPIAT